ncbi:MAG: hypothetical protein GX637_07965 [Clostridiales bacterium]|nr:hypothetical protein [Clostridiales bacterium]
MKRKSSLSLGPGASSLILIFVVLSMSILGMLSLLTARNDLNLSQRSAGAAEMVYRLRERAEERRAAVGRLLASGETLEAAFRDDPQWAGLTWDGECLTWAETDGTRTLSCALRVDGGTAWAEQRLTTNIGEETEQEREAAMKLALADRILARQNALDALLARCAEGAADWNDYLARVSAALPEEPMAQGVSLAGSRLTWVETDGTYSYACTVIIHPLQEEHRSDFDGVPALLDEEEEAFSDGWN